MIYRSILDYGAVALDSMSESNKKKLDVIQMQGLRIAIGAICGTANSAIQVDMGNHHCSLDAYSNSFSMLPKLNRHTVTQQGKFLKDIGQFGGGNIMIIRLQYILKHTIQKHQLTTHDNYNYNFVIFAYTRPPY